jgi:hypothetical protein
VYSSTDYLIEQITEIEMSRSCGAHGGEVYTGFRWRNVKEGLGIVGRIILKLILQK